jgi:hypothetical protein
MGQDLVRYHHTTEEFVSGLLAAGFRLDGLREGRPRREQFLHEETYERRRRTPLFLLLAASKPA